MDLYQSQHSFVWQYGSSLVEVLAPQTGERILDVGCGSGELTHQIAQAGATVIGMDSDSNMIDRALSQLDLSDSNGSATFFVGDARNFTLDNRGGPVDAVFSNAALHWVKNDPEFAVQSMSKALKPNGRFVVEFGGKGNVDSIVQASLSVLGRSSCDCYNPWYFPSIAEYSSILEANGIQVLAANLYDRPTKLQGDDAMANWLRMFGSAIFSNLSETDIDEAIDEIVAKLEPKLFDGEQWFADYRRIRIVGRKC